MVGGSAGGLACRVGAGRCHAMAPPVRRSWLRQVANACPTRLSRIIFRMCNTTTTRCGKKPWRQRLSRGSVVIYVLLWALAWLLAILEPGFAGGYLFFSFVIGVALVYVLYPDGAWYSLIFLVLYAIMIQYHFWDADDRHYRTNTIRAIAGILIFHTMIIAAAWFLCYALQRCLIERRSRK